MLEKENSRRQYQFVCPPEQRRRNLLCLSAHGFNHKIRLKTKQNLILFMHASQTDEELPVTCTFNFSPELLISNRNYALIERAVQIRFDNVFCFLFDEFNHTKEQTKNFLSLIEFFLYFACLLTSRIITLELLESLLLLIAY